MWQRHLGKHDPPPFDPPVAIGAHFRYLGIDMLCTAHSTLTPMGALHCVKSEYVATDGVLRMTTFIGAEIDALRSELARPMGTAATTESSLINAKDQP